MTPLFVSLFFQLFFQVRGIVSDPAGRPVEGARVACSTATTSTDSKGEFELPSACDATVTKPGFAPARVALNATTKQIRLDLAITSETVLVTAVPTPTAVEEAGVSASIFTAPDFQPPSFPFVQDLLREVPGLAVVQSGREGSVTSVFARGGDSSSALVLLDGIPLTEPGGYLDYVHLASSGLERMEVIRGPESALFGPEASSAVIQLFSRRGDVEARVPHGSLVYDRSSFSTDHWTAALDGGLANRIDYALTGDQFRTTGQFRNDAFRITSGTANLGFRFSDSTQLRAVFRELDSYNGDPGQVGYGLTNLDDSEVARDSAVGVHLDDARSAHFSQRVSFAYHRRRDRFEDRSLESYDIAGILRTEGDRTYFLRLADPNQPTAPPGTFFEAQSVSLYPFSSLSVADRTRADYQGTVAHPHGTLIFGYSFERQAGIVSGTTADRRNHGFFVQEQYSLGSRVILTGGARLEHSSVFGEKFTPRGAVTFRLPTETYFRLSLSRGIQEPSLTDNFSHTTFFAGNPNLKPEKTDSFEAALSREWLSGRIRTQAAYFRNLFTDLIRFDFSVNPATTRNVARSYARGLELSGTARLTGYLSVRAAYTRLYTRVINDSDPSAIGLELVRRPRNAASLSLQLAPRRWTFAAGARYFGDRQEDDFVFFAANRNPSYWSAFADGSWQATRHVMPFLRVDNLLNSYYEEVLGYPALSRSATAGVRLSW